MSAKLCWQCRNYIWVIKFLHFNFVGHSEQLNWLLLGNTISDSVEVRVLDSCLGDHGSSPNVSGVIVKKVCLPADCLLIYEMWVCFHNWKIWLFFFLFVKLHDEGKSALPSLDRAIWYDDAKMHCYECCLSTNTSNGAPAIRHSGVPQIIFPTKT